MANPAELLAVQLTEWSEGQSTTAYGRRGKLEEQSAEAHIRAATHLSAIRELFDEMDAQGLDSKTFRDYWDKWVRALFVPGRNWEHSGSASINADDLAMLKALGVTLRQVCSPVDKTQFADLRRYLRGVEHALKNDETLRQELKSHLVRVISHVRWCVDNYDTVGDYDLRRAVKDLEAEIVRVTKFSRAKHHWWFATTHVGLPAVVSIASAPVGAAFTRMIAGG